MNRQLFGQIYGISNKTALSDPQILNSETISVIKYPQIIYIMSTSKIIIMVECQNHEQSGLDEGIYVQIFNRDLCKIILFYFFTVRLRIFFT